MKDRLVSDDVPASLPLFGGLGFLCTCHRSSIELSGSVDLFPRRTVPKLEEDDDRKS